MKAGNINVLITGGFGFIGRALVKKLVSTGMFNINILDPNVLGGKGDNVFFSNGSTQDLREEYSYDINMFFSEDGWDFFGSPDIVFHLGEFSRVEQSFDNFGEVLANNMAGTAYLLKMIHEKCPDATLLYAGSSTRFSSKIARYESPYAFTKWMNAELVNQLHNWFRTKSSVLYFYNVFGEGENTGSMGTVVGTFAEKFLNDEPITVNGGLQTRRFTYIDDVANNLAKLALDIGSGKPLKQEYHFIQPHVKETSIFDLAEMFYDDENKIIWAPQMDGCRSSSIDDSLLNTLIRYGKYETSLKSYVKSIVDMKKAR